MKKPTPISPKTEHGRRNIQEILKTDPQLETPLGFHEDPLLLSLQNDHTSDEQFLATMESAE